MRIGRNFKLYIGGTTLAAGGTTTWTEMLVAGNATQTMTATEFDSSVRSVYDTLTTPTGITREVTFDLMDHALATYVGTLETHFNAGTIFSFAITNGPIATVGTKGVRFDAACVSFTRGLGVNDAVVIAVTVKPALSLASNGTPNAPEAFTVPTPPG